ncbi:Maltose permease, partial [Lachnellula occidentalis]
IMESYDVFLMGNFVALPAFANKFGIWDAGTNKYVIATKWQSALQVSGQLGALIGVFIAGPLTSRIGYRYATLTGLMLLNVFIFAFYFANSLPVIFVAQLLEGVPWGIFIANAPAYCSEIVPIKLRAPATQMLQMFWAIGSIIVGAVTYRYNTRLDEAAYKYVLIHIALQESPLLTKELRIPIALQWMFPTPLAILVFCAPESPWWLVRKGRLEEAAHAVGRLGRRSRLNPSETVAMMRRTVELETSTKEPNHLELFKGTDLYRTVIVCAVYLAQNLTGNLIANQAVYFFEQAGVSTNTAFALGLITSALQMIFVMLSWILTTYFGRRSIYLWGSGFNVVLLIALGVAASCGKSNAASLAQASLGLIISVLFTLGPAPASWVIIGETSAIRLRPLTTGIGRATYYIIEIPCIFLGSYMLNPTGGDLGGKCGYVWGGTGLFCLVCAYFWLPEMKGRSYREIDILFKRGVPARQWKKTVVDVQDDE